MKAKYILTAIAAITACGLSAQSSQTREISSFTKIDASGAPTISYRQSDTLSLTVEANASEFNNIETKVSDNTLFIKASGTIKGSYKIKITGNTLNNLSLSGATNFKTIGNLKADSLTIEASGASNINIDCETRSIKTIAAGASQVNLSGTNKNLYADVSGASSLKAYKLMSENADVTASGASNAKIYTSQKLRANATGASSIKFKGEPKEVSAEGSSSSQIVKIAPDDSQKNVTGKDSSSTSFNWGNKKIIIADDDHKIDSIHSARERSQAFRHWNGVFFGVAGYTAPNYNFAIDKPHNYMELDYTRSFNWQINLFQQNIHIYKNYVNLATGLGFDMNLYHFENKVKLNADSSFTWGNVDSTNTFSYKKNRLSSYFVQVPLLLDFNTSSNPKKAFHICVGVVGKYLLGGRTKQIVVKNGDTFKNTRNDSYNMNPFQFAGYVSVGYGNVTLFAQSNLNEMFKQNKGPELYPFSVGVRLINFN